MWRSVTVSAVSSFRAALARTVPSRETGLTSVVDRDLRTLWRGRPSATAPRCGERYINNRVAQQNIVGHPGSQFSSRQTLAAALSRGAPPEPSTPAVGQAVRWSPRTSRAALHRQRRAAQGVGRRRLEATEPQNAHAFTRHAELKCCGEHSDSRPQGRLETEEGHGKLDQGRIEGPHMLSCFGTRRRFAIPAACPHVCAVRSRLADGGHPARRPTAVLGSPAPATTRRRTPNTPNCTKARHTAGRHCASLCYDDRFALLSRDAWSLGRGVYRSKTPNTLPSDRSWQALFIIGHSAMAKVKLHLYPFVLCTSHEKRIQRLLSG